MDTKTLIREISKTKDPIERRARLLELLEIPGLDLLVACRGVEGNLARMECEKMAGRPHLRTPAARTSRGRDFGGLVLPPEAVGTLAKVSPVDSLQCKGRKGGEWDVCQTGIATKHALKGSVVEAASHCAAIESELARDECMFLAAEAAIAGDTAAHAVPLCLASKRFAPQCFSHLSREIARSAPAPVTECANEWVALSRLIGSVVGAASDAGDTFCLGLRDRIWLQSFSVSMRGATRIDGSFLHLLPDEAVPHFSSALSVRVVQAWRGEGKSLAELVDKVLEGQRVGTELPVGPSGPEEFIARPSNKTRGREGELPTVMFLNGRRRLYSSDERTDVTICVLEAMGQLGEIDEMILRDALREPSVLVRSTAESLIPP